MTKKMTCFPRLGGLAEVTDRSPARVARTLGRCSVAASLMVSLMTLSAGVPAFAQDPGSRSVVDRFGFGLPLNRGDGDTFGPGERISATVLFSEPVVVTGNPRLVLQIGDERRSADLARVSENRLTFHYFVRTSDRDDDGLGIPANAILLNRGTIRDSRGNDADLTHEAVSDEPRLKVNGRLDAVPTIRRLSLSQRPRQGDTFRHGEAITVSVYFSESDIVITGEAQLALQVGTQTRMADAHLRRGFIGLLSFAYVVQSSDVDADGVSVPADALVLNGGSIRDGDGNDADLTHDAVPDDPTRKVNGASVGVPTVTGLSLGRLPGSADTYASGEKIFASVAFSRGVRVTGSPRFTLQVGAQERQAEHLPALRAPEPPPVDGFHHPGESERFVYFQYVVQPEDVDDDGVSAPANALTLNGGSIRAIDDDSDADLSHDGLADDPTRKVDGTRGDGQAPAVLSISMEPPVRGTFGGGDTITVRLSMNEGVTVTGEPRFALRIGARTRYATLREMWATSSLLFDYVVDESDRDDNGLSVAADAIDLNGGTIRDNAGNDAELDLGYFAFNDDPNYKVNGALTAVPALPLYGVVALVFVLLGGGWRRLPRRPACRR